jgi:hypothetical protein
MVSLLMARVFPDHQTVRAGRRRGGPTPDRRHSETEGAGMAWAGHTDGRIGERVLASDALSARPGQLRVKRRTWLAKPSIDGPRLAKPSTDGTGRTSSQRDATGQAASQRDPPPAKPPANETPPAKPPANETPPAKPPADKTPRAKPPANGTPPARQAGRRLRWLDDFASDFVGSALNGWD